MYYVRFEGTNKGGQHFTAWVTWDRDTGYGIDEKKRCKFETLEGAQRVFASIKKLAAKDPTRSGAIVKRVACDRCQGTGVYRWGTVTDGRGRSGECYRCCGQGFHLHEVEVFTHLKVS